MYETAIAQLLKQQKELDAYFAQTFEAAAQHLRQTYGFVAVRARFVVDKVVDVTLEVSARLRPDELSLEEREWADAELKAETGLSVVRSKLKVSVDTATRWTGKNGPAPHPDECFLRYYDLDFEAHPGAQALGRIEEFNIAVIRLALFRHYAGRDRLTFTQQGME